MLGGPPRRLLEELTPLVHTSTKNNPLDLGQGADVLSQISADNHQIGDIALFDESAVGSAQGLCGRSGCSLYRFNRRHPSLFDEKA